MAMVVIDGDHSDCGTPRRDVFRAHPHGVGEGIYSVSLWFPYPRRIARDGRAHGSHLPRSHRAVSAPHHSRGHPSIDQSHVCHRHGAATERFRDDVTWAKV